ncbi:protein of unknown function [Shinella sp. WSC3-e]|nr:hypothetical protein SHINE37_40924 [Rhizobiaceae bacterium]CAK7255588.1 protein of unknown function [Shinella sp. WSC3-e]
MPWQWRCCAGPSRRPPRPPFVSDVRQCSLLHQIIREFRHAFRALRRGLQFGDCLPRRVMGVIGRRPIRCGVGIERREHDFAGERTDVTARRIREEFRPPEALEYDLKSSVLGLNRAVLKRVLQAVRSVTHHPASVLVVRADVSLKVFANRGSAIDLGPEISDVLAQNLLIEIYLRTRMLWTCEGRRTCRAVLIGFADGQGCRSDLGKQFTDLKGGAGILLAQALFCGFGRGLSIIIAALALIGGFGLKCVCVLLFQFGDFGAADVDGDDCIGFCVRQASERCSVFGQQTALILFIRSHNRGFGSL